MPLDKNIKKVLVIGSGPIVIGQAAEFDYAGAQACRVLRDEGIETVLVNSNPATIMTDRESADEIYLEPLTEKTLERIIEKEKPDSLLAGLGGQTGLTLAMRLSSSGFLDRAGVRLLGTDAAAIDRAEDREMFRDTMRKLGQPTVPSEIATDVDGALAAAEKIGYPVIIRPAFTLGGAGGGVARSAGEMRERAQLGLDMSPITQILVEKYIFGWKEIEFETLRDSAGNAVAVCSMENVDPVGVHTGDSVVVSPCLTLSDKEFQMLRSASLDIISELGIVGGCNCQFALNPDSFEYAVIEVNPRVSRSSALASKATGYPIAKVSTKIALGYTLDEIKNDVTGKTCACFEPALDYVVVKFPKWPFDKFRTAERTLGTQMKATGEVMAIGQSFEEALMKAVRGAECGTDTLRYTKENVYSSPDDLSICDDRRLFRVFAALLEGETVGIIHEKTRIDRFFIDKIKKLADFERCAAGRALNAEEYRAARRMGYTDGALERLSAHPLPEKLTVSYKTVDACAAEFEAQTPYFYSSCDTVCESRGTPKSGKKVIMVLGSGPIRIGQGIEFDYSCVRCVRTLRSLGYEVVTVNNNPETVSTDYDTADRLYFEPLCEEDVMNVIEAEHPVGVVVAFGGQTAIRLTSFLDRAGIRIFGTSAESIDTAEDRAKFDALLERFSIRRPKGEGVLTMDEALGAAERLGYPVLLRPSYVIGGQNMVIAHDSGDVRRYMELILSGSVENPVLIDKYMPGCELEVDVISDGENVLIPGIMEHVERAGVHSGDSIAVYPPFNLTDRMQKTVVDSSTKLALALGTRGLVNIQYLIYRGDLYVIEVNPRASRTVPYISKVTGVPMVDIASRVMLGEKLADIGCGTGLHPAPPYFTVKVPVFSFGKLTDANSILGPEMKSTGEVLGVGKTYAEAMFKGLRAAGYDMRIPTESSPVGMLVSVDNHDLPEVVTLAKKLGDAGVNIWATPDTAAEIASLGIPVSEIEKASDAVSLMESGKISYVVYTGALVDSTIGDFALLHRHALRLSVCSITSLDTANALCDILLSRFTEENTELVNINRMRTKRLKLPFVKMEAAANDYLYFDDRDGSVSAVGAQSLCVGLCDRHRGIGADGIVLIGRSDKADASMKIYNRDGTLGRMAGNAVRCVGKFLYDRCGAESENLTVETDSGVKSLKLYISSGKASSVTVDMGCADFSPKSLPVTLDGEEILERETEIGGESVRISCVSVGNPHAVIFTDGADSADVGRLGPLVENAPFFPERTNVEFVRVVNETTLKMRVWERGNGETLACGTGACAAAAVAARLGFVKRSADITVKVRGGDLTVSFDGDHVLLTGGVRTVFEGTVEI